MIKMEHQMEHQMKLFPGGFYGIKEGKQLIEVRLYDEKRRTLNIGDTITFSKLPELKETIRTEVLSLLRYRSFQELFKDINLEQWNAKDWTVEQCVQQCRKYYSKEEEKRYGVLGIKIRLI